MTLRDPRNATLSTDPVATATITDVEHPAVTVSYGARTYTVGEGASVEVEVILSAPSGRPVTIPVTHVPAGGAGPKDYSGVPDNVRFASFETHKTFNVVAEEDAQEDAGESVILGFGTLPPRVTTAEPERATVTIVDTTPAGAPSTDRLAQAVRWHRGVSGSGCTRRTAAVRGRAPVRGLDSRPPHGSRLALYAVPGTGAIGS